jgi:RNA methyltransferase, TrmH family
VFYAPGAEAALVRDAAASGADVYALASGVIESVADAVTPQPVCAVLPALDAAIDALPTDGVVVVAVDVRDPGNAGTLVRAAAAAGARGVVLCDGCVELYNPKTVRATAGALFRLPVVTSVTVDAALTSLGAAGRRRLAAVARGGEDYASVDLTRPVAFVVGNEAHGLPAALSGIDGGITIPMPGSTESLNVGVATAVLCFEAARQARAVRVAVTR